MALTISKNGNFINVTFDGATAWDVTSGSGLTQDVPNGLNIRSIQMIPAAQNDVLTVRLGSATGTIIFKGKAADAYDSKIKYFMNSPEKRYKLYVKGDEATSGVMMIIEV